jgi:Protein of unknown function (DUF3551)
MRRIVMGVVLMMSGLMMSGGMAFAQDYTTADYCDPWCQGGKGPLGCSYHTFEQCLVTTRGLGTHCYENPLLHLCTRHVAAPDRPAHRKRSHEAAN